MQHKVKETQSRPPAIVIEALLDKIRSKMDVAKFFAGFIILLIGLLLENGGDLNSIAIIGLFFIISSLILCVATIFSYDTLLMPREFWSKRNKKRLTQVEYRKLLRNEMMSSWRSCFIGAVVCFGVGLSLTIVAKLMPNVASITDSWQRVSIFLLFLAIAIPIMFAWRKRPRI